MVDPSSSALSILLLLGAALSFVFGWNNSAFLLGNGQGSGSLTLREALLVSSAGLLLGVVVGASSMLKGLSSQLSPHATDQVAMVALGVTIALTVLLTLAKLPVAFSAVLVGSLVGAAARLGFSVVYGRVVEVAAFWFLAPVLAGVLAYTFHKVYVKIVAGRGLLGLDLASRYGVIVTAFFIALVLGANNEGLIYGTLLNGASPSVLALTGLTCLAILGMFVLGRGGASGTVGDKLMTLSPLEVVSAFAASGVLIGVATLFAIPISLSQCLLGGMVGAALTRRVTITNNRLLAETFSMWAIIPLVAFGAGYLVSGF